MSTRTLGIQGESIAATFLQHKGYTILERNLRTPFGEIDLVARHGKTIVFVEVKRRSSEAFGEPIEAVTRSKMHRLQNAAWAISQQKYPNAPIRIDIITIMGDTVSNHLQNIEIS